MNKITLTRDQIHDIMQEFTRRLDMDIHDGAIPLKWPFLREEISSRMQGVYGTIMSLVSNENWRQIVWWLDEEVEQLYASYGYEEALLYDNDKNDYEWE